MCQLLEENQLVPCFPLLKSREKLYLQDICGKIYAKLKREFVPSLYFRKNKLSLQLIIMGNIFSDLKNKRDRLVEIETEKIGTCGYVKHIIYQ